MCFGTTCKFSVIETRAWQQFLGTAGTVETGLGRGEWREATTLQAQEGRDPRPQGMTVVVATQKLGIGEVCSAIRVSCPGCPPDRWSHGIFVVDELEDRVENEPQEHVDFGSDAEFEFEMEATVVLWSQ